MIIDIINITDEELYNELKKRMEDKTTLYNLLFVATCNMAIDTNSGIIEIETRLEKINKKAILTLKITNDNSNN